MDFIALDVETANADMASICQIGIAKFENGLIVEEWSSLIDPEDYFAFINVDIHGITEDDVVGCPKFNEVAETLGRFMNDAVCVSHTHFDRVSMSRALRKYSLDEFDSIWLDSAKVARRAWEEFAWKGYGLSNICNKIGYEFQHHDALEDAKAAGHVLLAANEVTGLGIDDWLKRVNGPIDLSQPTYHSKVSKDGNPEGALYGEIIVFTGALALPRREAAELAASIGCAVTNGVTRKTTILVVGDQDVSRLVGKAKSGKQIKAEKLAAEGQKIRILKESDFREMVTVSSLES